MSSLMKIAKLREQIDQQLLDQFKRRRLQAARPVVTRL